jgi:hypothetical protein
VTPLSRAAEAVLTILASMGGAAPHAKVEAEFLRVRPDLMSDADYAAWKRRLRPVIRRAYKRYRKRGYA